MLRLIVKDSEGVLRFKENKIVRYLLDNGGIDLNQLLSIPSLCNTVDVEEFYQLIGYSITGYMELSFISDESCKEVEEVLEDIRTDYER